MSPGAGRDLIGSATPLPVPPRLNFVAVIVVEKLLCTVLSIDYRDFPEIVPAHISPIVFSTMGGKGETKSKLRCVRAGRSRALRDRVLDFSASVTRGGALQESRFAPGYHISPLQGF